MPSTFHPRASEQVGRAPRPRTAISGSVRRWVLPFWNRLSTQIPRLSFLSISADQRRSAVSSSWPFSPFLQTHQRLEPFLPSALSASSVAGHSFRGKSSASADVAKISEDASLSNGRRTRTLFLRRFLWSLHYPEAALVTEHPRRRIFVRELASQDICFDPEAHPLQVFPDLSRGRNMNVEVP